MKILWKSLLNGLKIGCIVATIIMIFFVAESGKLNWTRVGLTYMFSIAISFCVGYGINLYNSFKTIINKNNIWWVDWVGYYLAALIGMTIASESCFFIMNTLVLNIPYRFFSEPVQLLINLIIAIIVTTILGFYNIKKAGLEAKIKQKELEVLKVQKLKTEAELQTLQSRINPHFLYNALNSIASLIHQDPDKAEDMTIKLSKLFRYSINTQNENLTSVKEEIEILTTYFDIEKVRFGQRIQFNIDADADILSLQLPRFILQPLAENALKHGLNQSAANAELNIALKKNNAELEITVADNGLPFPDEINTGYGLQSTYDKLNLIYNDRYSIQIMNKPTKCIKIIIPAFV